MYSGMFRLLVSSGPKNTLVQSVDPKRIAWRIAIEVEAEVEVDLFGCYALRDGCRSRAGFSIASASAVASTSPTHVCLEAL
jgi:hypothetical protein